MAIETGSFIVAHESFPGKNASILVDVDHLHRDNTSQLNRSKLEQPYIIPNNIPPRSVSISKSTSRDVASREKIAEESLGTIAIVGLEAGLIVDGKALGIRDGIAVGTMLGTSEGKFVGKTVEGCDVGAGDGDIVGDAVGSTVGT